MLPQKRKRSQTPEKHLSSDEASSSADEGQGSGHFLDEAEEENAAIKQSIKQKNMHEGTQLLKKGSKKTKAEVGGGSFQSMGELLPSASSLKISHSICFQPHLMEFSSAQGFTPRFFELSQCGAIELQRQSKEHPFRHFYPLPRATSSEWLEPGLGKRLPIWFLS